MRSLKSLGVSMLVSASLLVASAASAFAAPSSAMMGGPVKTAMSAKFGEILVTPKLQAIYYFTPEKDGKIHCTGKCAAVWPPVLVSAGEMMPATMHGVMGKFGTIMRPDGKRQVTFAGKPLYTFVQDVKPLQVLCNGVDGWYVVRVMGH